eukprot:CAMPEP_0202894662 /NCGR_PEP_ID=MMETSP1392-20130828/4017_1 /ASSEMBLY_ACC=CAM_ASM_000868 /TAXON_ID=225041 /ORGANISM="Chlamydomonas chlamydogama, Strain SAG 11-48b" /LENGTH=70 /DNA_ID=CAMNT_0049579421 /DNA_START=81 /DNA_END=293 /DNA_ORIENTATION=-
MSLRNLAHKPLHCVMGPLGRASGPAGMWDRIWNIQVWDVMCLMQKEAQGRQQLGSWQHPATTLHHHRVLP